MEVNLWTVEDEALLKEVVLEKRTAREISALFPERTRNAIISKVSRLGLTLYYSRNNPERAADKLYQSIHIKLHKTSIKNSKMTKPKRALKPVFKRYIEPEVFRTIPETRVSLLDIESSQCVFPVDCGNDIAMFCGVQKEHLDRPYCNHHLRISYASKRLVLL